MFYKIIFTETLTRSEQSVKARQALKELLESQGVTSSTLEIENYHHLKDLPHIRTSLTHTKGAVAAAISLDSSIKAIGIDIEKESRVITPRAESFFIHPDDDRTYSPLLLWCIKEASYKALSSYLNLSDTLTMKDIMVQKGSFHYIPAQLVGRFELIIIRENDDLFNLVLANL